jgi:hypothetical protein
MGYRAGGLAGQLEGAGMEVADARATLVDLSDTTAVDTLTVTMPRRHVEEALIENEPVDLVLDLAQRDADGDTSETTQIAVAWERDELEDLLRRSDGESISMVFDEAALRRLLDPEFEAHGMRGALAVLAVAVAAGGAASAATAYPSEGVRLSGAAAIEQAAPGAQIEGVRSQAAQPSGPTAAAGIEATRSAEPLAAASGSAQLASGIEAVRSAEPLAAGTGSTQLAAADAIEAARSAEPLAAGTGSAQLASGIEAVRSAEPLAAGTGSTQLASGIEAVRSAEPLAAGTGSTQLAAADAIEAARSAEPMPASSDTGVLASASGIEAARSAEAASLRTPAPSDGGITLSMPSPEATAGIVGGFALMLMGAAFVARSKRHELRLP